MKRNIPLLLLVLLSATSLRAQQVFRYSADLTAITNDRLTVTVQVPPLKKATVEFSFPKMIPGTYRIADYGKFVSDVRAFDKSGKALPVKKTGTNTWKITSATSLSKITYTVEDIFDTEVKHNIYPMAATNFEPGNISLHTPGIFGFIEGYDQSVHEISLTKPASMYGATSMQPVSSSSTHETYRAANLNELYESPVMYTVPDTTSVTVGNAQVLVSVYSPGKLVRSKQIAEWMHDLLEAARLYLGGRLPTDKYAFLFYFKDLSAKHSFPENLMGALEHPASSYYYLPDVPAEEMKSSIIDIASHEFFHIVTPLTIASREVKQFNYTQPKMSQHLWLYEGSTEYTAHHVQVKYGLKTVNQFLEELSSKITVSRRMYDDKLPFTELSRHATDRHRAQYGNVYQKGALIAACLDLLLLDLSGGTYGFRNLTYDLGIRYGKDRFFEDDQLFDEIAALTWPDVKDFLVKYVAGPTPIPYEEYFALAGFRFTPRTERKAFSLGGFTPGVSEKGVFFIQPGSSLNEFGKALGYREGDEIYAFNGARITPQNFGHIVDSLRRNMKEGDLVQVLAGRMNATGGRDTITLSAKAFPVTTVDLNRIDPMPFPTRRQEAVRTAWLTTRRIDPVEHRVDSADVRSIESIIPALYDVISGPAGPRNWERFHALFLPGATMGASTTLPGNVPGFRSMTTMEYQQANTPHFNSSGFFEEEIGRRVSRFGNIAMVESAYQFRMTPDGPVQQRGVNYITLAFARNRWWIVNISWQPESAQSRIPEVLLSAK